MFKREGLEISEDSRSPDIQRWDLGVFIAKAYVDSLRENVKRSMDYIRKQGRWQHRAPLGYINISDTITHQKTVVLDRGRASLVKRMIEEYSTGTHSLKSITERSAPTKTAN